MERPSRQLNAFPCRACGGTLLVHDEGQRELVCPLCETTMKVPRRLREDFDMGKKLPFDADGELQRAIDEAVERRYAAPELPRWVFLALALLGAGLGATAWVLSEPAPETLDYVWGALAGLALGVLPIGWTASWMATMRLGRAAERATRRVRGRDHGRILRRDEPRISQLDPCVDPQREGGSVVPHRLRLDPLPHRSDPAFQFKKVHALARPRRLEPSADPLQSGCCAAKPRTRPHPCGA